MGLSLTPTTLEASYEFLKALLPFRRWKLPHVDEIEFRVTASEAIHGRYLDGQRHHVISVSAALTGHLVTLLETMAHEMIHLAQALDGTDSENEHNPDFKRRAKLVCRTHGFDPKSF